MCLCKPQVHFNKSQESSVFMLQCVYVFLVVHVVCVCVQVYVFPSVCVCSSGLSQAHDGCALKKSLIYKDGIVVVLNTSYSISCCTRGEGGFVWEQEVIKYDGGGE